MQCYGIKEVDQCPVAELYRTVEALVRTFACLALSHFAFTLIFVENLLVCLCFGVCLRISVDQT